MGSNPTPGLYLGIIMKVLKIRETIEIPGNISVKIKNKKMYIKGPKGIISRDFSNIRRMLIFIQDKKIIIESFRARKKEYATVKTIAAIIRNLINGVLYGYRYKMKIVYAHFPISVEVKNNYVYIKNFMGKKDTRAAKIVGDTKVIVKGDEIIIEGIDPYAVSQTAGNIHLATRLRGKDRLCPHGREGRGPGILDGIYLYEKTLLKQK